MAKNKTTDGAKTPVCRRPRILRRPPNNVKCPTPVITTWIEHPWFRPTRRRHRLSEMKRSCLVKTAFPIRPFYRRDWIT